MGLLLESIVAILLVITIGYCYVLDKRLRALRSGQDGFGRIVEELERATGRAQSGVTDLRQTSEILAHDITSQMAAARALADELSVMVAAGNEIAERLDDRPSLPARGVPLARRRGQVDSGTGNDTNLYDKLKSAS